MAVTKITYTLDQLTDVAKRILEKKENTNILAFYGDMGAGKTTLINAICQQLNVEDIVTSPTFAIINEYSLPGEEKVYHFDFYRIRNIMEVYDIGFEDYIDSGFLCLIEWPEKIEQLLPEHRMDIHISIKEENERVIDYSIL